VKGLPILPRVRSEWRCSGGGDALLMRYCCFIAASLLLYCTCALNAAALEMETLQIACDAQGLR
jgi:hypothetical protein